MERGLRLVWPLPLRMMMLLEQLRRCSPGHQLSQPFCPAQERQHGAAEGFAKNVSNENCKLEATFMPFTTDADF